MPKKQKKYIDQAPWFILAISRILNFVSHKIAEKYARYLFITPIKYKAPKREEFMIQQSKKSSLFIPSINKNIQVYEWGNDNKKILLIHGWSGRGTQLVKIAEKFIEQDYTIISFDAPAHGKSESKSTNMLEFIACIEEIEKKYGNFELAIGHSLGGMSLLNAIKNGFKINKGIIIGSGNSVQDITEMFVQKIGLPIVIADKMKISFEKQLNYKMEDLSAYIAAKSIETPILVIHDENDNEIPVSAAFAIFEQLKNGKIYITKKLGHRKILGDNQVINQILEFINEN